MNESTAAKVAADATAGVTAAASAHELDEQDFDSVLGANDRLAIIDFSAPWCGPCRVLEPILGELAAELQGRVDFFKVDVDRSQQLAIRYGVQAVPTLVFLRAGRVVDRLVGLPPKQTLAERIRGHAGTV
jgi:thioredoxin 1